MDVEDYLEGMLWTRCKNNGEAEYCTVGKHEVDESVVKRSCVDRQTTLESIIPSA